MAKGMFIIPVIGNLEQEDDEFETSLGYILKERDAKNTIRATLFYSR